MITPKQQRRLDWMNRTPWRFLVSNRTYYRIKDRMEDRSEKNYFKVLNQIERYSGPDYRVRLADGNGNLQPTWIRATASQFDQAVQSGLPHSADGIPK
jgi:hypothetical protein